MSVVINGSAGVTTNSGAVYDGIQRGTAVTASGTSVDFTSIPSWAKRITVMFSGVSTSGTSNWLIQVGSGSISSSGYVAVLATGSTYNSYTTGFGIVNAIVAVDAFSGAATVNLMTGATYICQSVMNRPGSNVMSGTGSVTLAGTLDRIRITTVNGTDTFDAGTINILFE